MTKIWNLIRIFKNLHPNIFPSCFKAWPTCYITLLKSHQRTKRTRSKLFVHSGVIGLVFFGDYAGAEDYKKRGQRTENREQEDNGTGGSILGWQHTIRDAVSAFTQAWKKPPYRSPEYTIAAGDTVSLIASKFGVSEDTIYWEK